MIYVYGTYTQRRHLKKLQISKQSGIWKKSYTLVQCYSKCGLPPGAGPQTVCYHSAVKSRNWECLETSRVI